MNHIKNLLKQKNIIISGPCSAETENQLVETAVQLASIQKIHILRAGIWKPRTRPGSFEGVGSVGLPWLITARKQTGLPLAIEVATAKQVEEALYHNIDLLWIGARTTVNPFSVQELADALKGVDIPILIKNPVNADLELWQGAVERIAKSGIDTIGLIHRGFSSYGNTDYRNAPMWQLAIEMKTRHSQLPMICDPSHICGKRDTLLDVAQKSIDLNYDGLMIESHIDPDKAWSDAQQQITPLQLLDLLNQIIWKSEDIDETTFNNTLLLLRERIDQIDDELLDLISRRMKIADQLGVYKKQNNVTILQTKRWNDILERAFAKAPLLGLSNEFIIKYLDAIHLESIQHQNKA